MKKLGFFIASIFWTQILLAQKYQEVLPPENIKTIQLFNPQTNDHTPVIRMGDEYLMILKLDLKNTIIKSNITMPIGHLQEFFNRNF
mgnify:CR=1 FL=1